MERFALTRLAVEIGDRIRVGSDHHHLVVTEFDRIAGVLDECGDVGTDEHLTVTDAHHERRGPACGDDRAGMVGWVKTR